MADWGIPIVDDEAVKLSPLEKNYFTGENLAKYEPCVEALKNVVESEGKDEDQWQVFEEHFEKFLNFSWCSSWDGKVYDLVFYGVSGYTGYLMMEYLKRVSLKRNPEPFTFAFGGRTPSKVAEMRDREFLGTEYEDTHIFQASYDDIPSVIDMVRSARCIINVAGPYMLSQGEVMIDICCHMGVHYCDVSGEIPWTLRTMELDAHARKGGACIIPSSAVAGGYPDLVTFMLAKKLRQETGEELRISRIYNRGGGASAGASGGTLATRAAMSSAGDDVRKKMADPFALGGYIPDFDRNGMKIVTIKQGTGEVIPKIRKEEADALLSKMSVCDRTGVWRAPHVYAYFDTRIVRRSNALLANYMNQPYGLSLNFQEFIMLPPDAAAFMAFQASAPAADGGKPAAAAPAAMKDQAAEQEMLEQQGKYFKQGEGPPLEELSDAWIGFFGYAETTGGHSARLALCGGDGYFETARCAVECAMTLVFDWDELPIKGGHLTATVAGQEWYFKRLLGSGLKYWPEWPPEEELGPIGQ